MDWSEIVKVIKEIFIQYNLLIVIAGILATHLTGWIKSAVQWKRRAALVISILVALGLAILTGWVQGNIANVSDITRNFVAIFAVAQIFYKGIINNKPIELEPTK